MEQAPVDPWLTESELICYGLTDHFGYLLDLVDSVEFPLVLQADAEAADLDPTFEEDFNEWMSYLSERDLFLAVEQSCNAEGLLLPWDMRAVRLSTLPPLLLSKLHLFFERCPRHTRALLVRYVFWLVRFERLQRGSSPDWKP